MSGERRKRSGTEVVQRSEESSEARGPSPPEEDPVFIHESKPRLIKAATLHARPSPPPIYQSLHAITSQSVVKLSIEKQHCTARKCVSMWGWGKANHYRYTNVSACGSGKKQTTTGTQMLYFC